jgi:AhpD family alkylhydroperoxidase
MGAGTPRQPKSAEKNQTLASNRFPFSNRLAAFQAPPPSGRFSGIAAQRLSTINAQKKEHAVYDMTNLKKLKNFADLAPAAWKGFLAFDEAAMADGAVSAKTKELIAVAVAVTTQCPYCIEIHGKRAKAAGNSEAEIAEAVLVAAVLRAGGSVTHGTHCLD